MVISMGEREDAIEDLEGSGFLGAVRWAWDATRQQSLQAYDPDTGHTPGWLGTNTYTILMDRLDRVFSCNKYAVEAGSSPDVGADLLAVGLTQQESQLMPSLDPFLVVYDDVNQSPGWRQGQWRMLLQSFNGHDIDRIPWRQKSPTKQRVARQPNPNQLALPDPEFFEAADVLADVLEPLKDGELPVSTLVGAHMLDGLTGKSAFYLGRPQLASGRNSEAWRWKELLTSTNGDEFGFREGMPTPTPSEGPTTRPVEDAPVRMKRLPGAPGYGK